jgi:predicted lipoprotein with Yx(FWY)xxD motif
MKHKLVKLLAATSFAFSIQAALAADAPKMANGILVDAAGRTLYTFDGDKDGKSACNGACAAAWPPGQATAETARSADFSIIAREDGTDQWTFKGKPLYRFAGDARPGDVNGDNEGGVARGAQCAAAAGEPIRRRDALRLLTARG